MTPARPDFPRPDAADDAWRPTPPNRWATVSLIFGLGGFLGVTACAAIFAGLVGRVRAEQTGVGRRAATAGMWLGAAWIVILLLTGAGGVWVTRRGAGFVAGIERPRVVAAINGLEETATFVDGIAAAPAGSAREPGRVDRAAEAAPPASGFEGSRIRGTRAKELAEVVRPLGRCLDVKVGDAAFTNRDGVFGVSFDGTAVFDRGTWPLRGRLIFDGRGWTLTELDWQ